MALMASLFATMILTGLGLSLVLLGSAETALAARDWQAVAAAQAAHGALALATSELRGRPDWVGVVTGGAQPEVCAAPGGLVDPSLAPRSPWDGSMSLDLAALTHQRQAASDAAAPPGLPGPVWRLFDYGPISRLIPASGARPPFYVAVWAADGADGLLVLRATALGADGLTASVEASLMRQPDGVSVGRMAIRAVP